MRHNEEAEHGALQPEFLEGAALGGSQPALSIEPLAQQQLILPGRYLKGIEWHFSERSCGLEVAQWPL
jgi:hypothetical protein